MQHKHNINMTLLSDRSPLESKNQVEDNLYVAAVKETKTKTKIEVEAKKEAHKEKTEIEEETKKEAQHEKALIIEQKEHNQCGSANIF